MSESHDLKRILAHERIWQSLNDKATQALDAFGVKDYQGRADYWSVRESGIFRQAADAGMSLIALDNGTYVPN
jgi:hypothetical protein